MDDLVEREGIYYKKFSDVPFTGEVEGESQGRFKNGKKDGPWTYYYNNGQLRVKGSFKSGEYEGLWVSFYRDGKVERKGEYKNNKMEGRWVIYDLVTRDLNTESSGVYKDGKKISD